MNATVPKPLQEIQNIDQLKRKLVREKGITLIIVPCWWDKQLERFSLPPRHALPSSSVINHDDSQNNSLAATIALQRFDLRSFLSVGDQGTPINESPPSGFFDKQITQIEDIGEPTNACFFTNSSINPTNW